MIYIFQLRIAHLKKLMEITYETNDYYKKRFDQADMSLQDLKSFQDYRQVPFLEKEDLRRDVKIMISRVSEHPRKMCAWILQKARGREFVTAGTSTNLLKPFKYCCFKAG